MWEQLLVYFEETFSPAVCGALAENYKIYLLIFLLCIPIYLLFVPFDWTYEVEDVGWEKKTDYERNKRQRKLGNLPPVYPNGWFALAESSKVKINEVINVAALVPKSAKVKKWHSYESSGFIFVWYHAERENPSWYPTHETSYPYIGRNQFEVNCHIQEIPENGSDLTHFTALHGASALSGGDLKKHEVGWARWLFRHEWSSSWEPKGHQGCITVQQNMLIFRRFRIGYCKINIQQLGPGLVVLQFMTTLGSIVLLQTVTPREPLIQTVIHRMYAPYYLIPYAKFILICECYMLKRDIMVWNNKMYLEKPLLTKEDSTISQYRRWFSQFYTPHSPTYSMATQGMDW